MAKKKFVYRWKENNVHHKRTFATRLQKQTFMALNRVRIAEERRNPKPKVPDLTFGAFAEKWLHEHAGVDKAETTVKEDEAVIRRYLMPAFESVLLKNLAADHLLEFRAKLKATVSPYTGRQLSPKTVNNILTLAKGILERAKERGLVAANPWTSVRQLPKVKTEMGFWTAEERDRFVAFCRHRDPEFTELVLVASNTGMRLGELRALTRGQLDFDRRQIRVDASYAVKLQKRRDTTKNGEVGFIPMNAAVFEALKGRRLMRMDAHVFGGHLFAEPSNRLERRCQAVGVKVIRFHDLRHTFASILVMAGVPLYTVQKLMRHKSIAMTERYAHLAPDHLRDAIEMACAASHPPPKPESAPRGAWRDPFAAMPAGSIQ